MIGVFTLVLTDLMHSHKKEIKAFVKENRLKWDDLRDLTEIIREYDHLRF